MTSSTNARDRQRRTDSTTNDDPGPAFLRHDESGEWVPCTELIVDENDQGRICSSKQRPDPEADHRRWVCPNCGAATVHRPADPSQPLISDRGDL